MIGTHRIKNIYDPMHDEEDIMRMETIKNIAILVGKDLVNYIETTDVKAKTRFKGFTISAKEFLTDDGNNYKHILFTVNKEEDRLVINIAMLLDYFDYSELNMVVYDMITKITKSATENHSEEEITERMMDYFNYKLKK